MSWRAGLAALTLLLLAGCGSASLSTRDLRSRATRLCTIARRKTDRIATPSDLAAGATFLARGIHALSPELAGLRRLHPPHDLAGQYSAALTAFGAKLDALGAAVRALARGGDPVVEIKALQKRLAPLETREDGAWQALQIPACLNR